MSKTSILSILLISLIFAISCTTNQKDSTKDQRIKQLTNAYENGIKPWHETHQARSSEVYNSIKTLSNNLTIENLQQAKEQWRQGASAFKHCELYNIGEVNYTYIKYRIHRWPINHEKIEETINTAQSEINIDFVKNLGSDLIGLGAIEYLLFNDSEQSTIENLTANPKRLDYLLSASQYYENQSILLTEAWEDYSSDFTTAVESKISGGQNQLINALISFLEESIKVRLGKALGEANGGFIKVEKLEAFRSHHSLALLQNELEELHQCFTGNYSGGTNYGFEEYITELGNPDLADSVIESIDHCLLQIDALDDLETEIINNTSQVEALQSSLQNLAILLKADVASYIGATITVNDTDGD